MFDFVAKHKRILQLVLALTIVPFAFFGLESYTRAFRGAGDLASVNGSPITQREFSEELRRYQERVRAMIGRDADVSMFDTPEMRRMVLDSMIAQRLLLTEVASEHLTLSRDAVVNAILTAPEFQEGGKFSREKYENYLRVRGMSDEGNVEMLRLEIPASRLAGVLAASAFQPRAVARRLLAAETQKREVAEATVATDAYLSQVKPDEKQLKAYYEANAPQFEIPERVRAEYLVLSAAALGESESVTEDELKKAYEARIGRTAASEKRHASHILLKTKEEADKALAEARKSPQRFAELAKKLSQDSGSADNGGDLGLVTRGSLAAKPLEDVIFSLKENEIGGPVQTEFGYHVVRVTGIEAGKEKSFDEMKKDLAAELAKQKGEKKFGEVAQDFSNLVYEQSDSLKPAATRFKLTPQTSDWITRQSAGNGPLANPKLVAALFSSDSIQQRRNTDAIEVAPGVLVAARVAEHQPAKQRPFEEVRAEVERRVGRQEAGALARKEGAAKLAALAKGEDAGLKWSAPKTITRRDPQGLPPDAVQKVMALDPAKLPAYAGADRGEQGYVIYRLSKVVEAEAAAPSPDELARLDGQLGNEQTEAYLAALRARAKIDVNPSGLEKK
jgi:peptidyl-prolyl cis-trans isomerase D